MAIKEFALSDLAARLTGTDATLTTALRDVLAAALQELIEAELIATIGAAPGERSLERVTQRNGHRPKLVSTRPAMSSSGSRSFARVRSSPSCWSRVGGSTRRCGR